MPDPKSHPIRLTDLRVTDVVQAKSKYSPHYAGSSSWKKRKIACWSFQRRSRPSGSRIPKRLGASQRPRSATMRSSSHTEKMQNSNPDQCTSSSGPSMMASSTGQHSVLPSLLRTKEVHPHGQARRTRKYPLLPASAQRLHPVDSRHQAGQPIYLLIKELVGGRLQAIKQSLRQERSTPGAGNSTWQ